MLTHEQVKDVQSLPAWRPTQEESMALTTNDPVTVPVAAKRFSILARRSLAGEDWLQNIVVTIGQKMAEASKGFRVPFVERRLLLLVIDTLLILCTIGLAQQTTNLPIIASLSAQNLAWVGNYWLLTPAFLIIWWLIASFTDDSTAKSHDSKKSRGMCVAGTIGR
jgi:hypothetical protein